MKQIPYIDEVAVQQHNVDHLGILPINNDVTRRTVAALVEAYCEHLRALNPPIQSFRIICDESNNPPDSIRDGFLNVNFEYLESGDKL